MRWATGIQAYNSILCFLINNTSGSAAFSMSKGEKRLWFGRIIIAVFLRVWLPTTSYKSESCWKRKINFFVLVHIGLASTFTFALLRLLFSVIQEALCFIRRLQVLRLQENSAFPFSCPPILRSG